MFIRLYIVLLAVVLFAIAALTKPLGTLETVMACLPLLYVALDLREPV